MNKYNHNHCIRFGVPRVIRQWWIVLCAASFFAGLDCVAVFGGEFAQLTHFTGTHAAFNPSPSADGSRVVFSGPGGQLWGVNGDGSNLHRVTSGDLSPIYFASISADGTRVVFISRGNPTGENPAHLSQIFAVNWDGTETRQFPTVMPSVGEVCISGDGTKIVFTGGVNLGKDILVMNWDGSGLRKVTNNTDGFWGIHGPTTDYSGSRIAFWTPASLDGGPTSSCGVVWVVNSDGTGLRRLFTPADGNVVVHGFSLSNDGFRIAFAGPPLTWLESRSAIYSMNTDGTDLRQLTDEPDSPSGSCYYPSMDGAGSRVVFASSRDPDPFSLWTVNTDGTELYCLVAGWQAGSVSGPGGWQPRNFQFSRDGLSIVFVATSDLTGQNPHHAQQVFLWTADVKFVFPVGDPMDHSGAYMTQGLGSDFRGWKCHLGEDYAGPEATEGRPVRAVADGTLVWKGRAGPRWGHVIVLRHELADGTPIYSMYGHVTEPTIDITRVSRGQEITTVGPRAAGSSAPHLHFELKPQQAVDVEGPVGKGYAGISQTPEVVADSLYRMQTRGYGRGVRYVYRYDPHQFIEARLP